MSFRDEVFSLCNCLESMEEFEPLRHIMAGLRFTSSTSTVNPKLDVCMNGIKLNAEFHGILLAFQSGLTSTPNAEPKSIELTDYEFSQLSFGNKYICQFIELCLTEIVEQNSAIGSILSPYSFLKTVDSITDFEIDLALFEKAVEAFKQSSVYREIMDGNCLMAFRNVPEDHIRALFGAMYREIIQIPMDTVPREIFALKIREQGFRPNQSINPVDALHLVSFKLLALREMLSNAVSLLYDAILGMDLVVLDENRLISIEANSSNTIYSYRTILIQGGLLPLYNDELNTIILLHIDNPKIKVHDFGHIKSYTFNFSHDIGDTAKISYCVLDEELNPISNLTKKHPLLQNQENDRRDNY